MGRTARWTAAAALCFAGLLPGSAVNAAPARSILAEGGHDGVRCLIAATRESNGVVVRALVESAKSAQGKFELSVRKQGAAGSASIGQSGRFSVPAAGETEVGRVGLGADRGLAGDLRLTVDFGGRECVASYRGPLEPGQSL
jgi:hypothetical protein